MARATRDAFTAFHVHQRSSRLLFPRLLTLGVIFIIICSTEINKCIGGFSPMEVNIRACIPSDYISQRFYNVQSECSCRIRCAVQPKCTGVSIYKHANGVLDCYLSEKNPLRNWHLLPNDTVTTLLNYVKPGCTDPFAMLAGVGCIKSFGDVFPMEGARNVCHNHDSELFVSSLDTQLPPLWTHIVIAHNAVPGWEFWVGIREQKWFGGRSVTNWQAGQPDGTPTTQACGAIAVDGKIVDRDCSGAISYVCQRNV